MKMKISLGKICSTCRYALFLSIDYYYSRGKKQCGYCFVECDGSPPKKIQEWYDVVGFKQYARTNNKPMSVGEWEQKYISRWKHCDRPNTIAEVNRILKEEYKKLIDEYNWWHENWPKMKQCHRATTCESWELNNKAEPRAKSIVKKANEEK
jgi:hypothetical protein